MVTAMELLERNVFLDELHGLLDQAARDHGHMLFLGGEVGVGKTSLTKRFVEQIQPPISVLIGACEPLSTPRPHGPLSEMDD